MTTTVTSSICNRFAGIRRIDARFSDEFISCSDCQNVELFNTGINAGVGLRTAKGNISLYSSLPQNEHIINIFSSFQNSIEYCFIHTENETEGKIYSYANNNLTLKVSELSLTGNSCGTDYQQGFSDLFLFSNGVEFVEIEIGAETEATIKTLTDVEGRSVTGLGLKVFDSRLWIFNDNIVWYSVKGDCDDFETNDPLLQTSAGYIEFSKDITAIYPYLGSLAVFHKDSSALITVDSQEMFTVTDESPGGCCNYDSLVFHGTDLFFYDDTKKGVFSFQQVVNGDKTLGQNIALDVQEELLNIDSTKKNKIKALSVVLSDRNEVWFLIPQVGESETSTILIFDVIHREWVKRVEPTINCFRIIGTNIYSGGKNLNEEYNGSDFSGTFIPSHYNFTPLNLYSNNTLKILYFPPRVTLDSIYNNDFFVKYIKNFNFFKKPKIKRIKSKTLKNVAYWDMGFHWDDGSCYVPNSCSSIAKFPSATFKTIEISIYTSEVNQEFCIRNIEFSKIKVKQI